MSRSFDECLRTLKENKDAGTADVWAADATQPGIEYTSPIWLFDDGNFLAALIDVAGFPRWESVLKKEFTARLQALARWLTYASADAGLCRLVVLLVCPPDKTRYEDLGSLLFEPRQTRGTHVIRLLPYDDSPNFENRLAGELAILAKLELDPILEKRTEQDLVQYVSQTLDERGLTGEVAAALEADINRYLSAAQPGPIDELYPDTAGLITRSIENTLGRLENEEAENQED